MIKRPETGMMQVSGKALAAGIAPLTFASISPAASVLPLTVVVSSPSKA